MSELTPIPRKQFNMRVRRETLEKIRRLRLVTGLNQAQVVDLAVEELYKSRSADVGGAVQRPPDNTVQPA